MAEEGGTHSFLPRINRRRPNTMQQIQKHTGSSKWQRQRHKRSGAAGEGGGERHNDDDDDNHHDTSFIPTFSASAMIRSMSSWHVGTSSMRATTGPQLHTQLSGSPVSWKARR